MEEPTQNNEGNGSVLEKSEGCRLKREPNDVMDEEELVPFLNNQAYNTADDTADESVCQKLTNSQDCKSNGEDCATNNLSEESCSNTNGELSDGCSHARAMMNQTDSGTYEFRNSFEVVKLAESDGMDDHPEAAEGYESSDTEESVDNKTFGNECRMSHDYNILVQSLDASMVDDKFNLLATSPLTSSTCEDALSMLMMKRSICEPIDCLNYFEFMPIELIVHIFSFLTTPELCRHVARVCRQWRRISSDQSLWRCIDFTSFKSLDSLNLLWVVRRAPSLQRLVIRGRENISRAEIAIITEFCPDIQDINLGFCDSLNCDMLQCLVKNCPKLRRINVEGCEKIDSKCIRMLARCETLTHLNLSHCTILDSSLKYLCNNLKQLISINLDGISFTTDRVVVTMVSKHQNWLRELDLDGAEISDESMMYLSKCSQLKHFSMSFCECLTDQGLMYLKNLKNLEVLRLRKGTDFSVEGLISFFRQASLSQLYSLNLSECSEITDQVVLEMVKACGKNLRELALSWCWFITDTGLISILDHCNNLLSLDLLGIYKITGECLTRVPEEMQFLRYLDLQQCNKIVDSYIYELVRMKPDLQVMNYYGEKFVYGVL